MIIEIDNDLTPEGNLVDRGNGEFLANQLGDRKIHFVSRTGLAHLEPKKEMAALKYGELLHGSISKLYVGAHNAFDQHGAFSLRPEVLWYAIIHEIAVLVKSDPATYAKYFTKKPDEITTIKVRDNSLVYGSPDNDWLNAIGLFEAPLRENISKEIVDLFLPPFSTRSKESEAAILVSFMDTVSKYYKFILMTLCGIPRIKVEGTAQDWHMLLSRVNKLENLFPVLGDYFGDLFPVLEKIRDSFFTDSHDLEFWRSIYKINSQSGGDRMTGWLTAFNAFLVHPETKEFTLKKSFDWEEQHKSGHGGYLANMFPSHVSTVPFLWQYLNQEIPMQFFAGILGTEYQEDFFSPRLGVGVAEDVLP